MKRIIAIVFLVHFASAANAQDNDNAEDPGTLIADQILYTDDGTRWVADGNVEVRIGGKLLTATRLDYDGLEMVATGPLVFTEGTRTKILASYGELSEDFRDGILNSVRILLYEQWNVRATQVKRSEGRINQLDDAVITTCKMCEKEDVPLWHFRSRRVLHDQEKRRIVFHDTKFVVGNIPLFYMPWFTLPDPTVHRATGFLFPSLHVSSEKGVGVRVPYYWTLGDHADLEVVPFVSTKGRNLLMVEYRQRFRKGWFDLSGGLGSGKGHEKSLRGRLLANGGWNVAEGYNLSFSGQTVTDPAFLNDFDISSDQKIENFVRFTGRRPESYLEAGSTYINRLGETENSRLPANIYHEANWRKRFSVPGVGGIGGLTFGVTSSRNSISTNTRRKLQHQFVELDWKREWNLDSGMLFSLSGLARAGTHSIENDLEFPPKVSNSSSTAAVGLSWPLAKTDAQSHSVIEPFSQVVWTGENRRETPNEDSQIVEFDETNLVSLDRFAGRDRIERGQRLNLGIRHLRSVHGKYDLELTFGRVFRNKDLNQFSDASGLGGRHSDYVLTFDFQSANGYKFRQRALFDNRADLSKSESLFQYKHAANSLSVSRIWLEQDVNQLMTSNSESWVLTAKRELNKKWTGQTKVLYDVNKQADRDIELSLTYKHQCVDMNFTLTHELPSAESAVKDTKFGINVALVGLGASSRVSSAKCG